MASFLSKFKHLFTTTLDDFSDENIKKEDIIHIAKEIGEFYSFL